MKMAHLAWTSNRVAAKCARSESASVKEKGVPLGVSSSSVPLTKGPVDPQLDKVANFLGCSIGQVLLEVSS